MSTKSDLLIAWSEWAGDDIAEVRHRIRALSEAGLLPRRKQPLGYADIARALIGFIATTQHNQAAKAVRHYSDIECIAHQWKTKPEKIHWPSAKAARFTDLPLLDALVLALQPPLWIIRFDINITANVCRLLVGNGVAYKDSGKTYVSAVECVYRHRISIPLIGYYYQVNLSRSVHFPLVNQLLTDLMGHPQIGPRPELPVEPSETHPKAPQRGPRTKDAALPGATPQVEPSKTRPKADPAGSSPDSSDSIAWVWPPQFDEDDLNGAFNGLHH